MSSCKPPGILHGNDIRVKKFELQKMYNHNLYNISGVYKNEKTHGKWEWRSQFSLGESNVSFPCLGKNVVT